MNRLEHQEEFLIMRANAETWSPQATHSNGRCGVPSRIGIASNMVGRSLPNPDGKMGQNRIFSTVPSFSYNHFHLQKWDSSPIFLAHLSAHGSTSINSQ